MTDMPAAATPTYLEALALTLPLAPSPIVERVPHSSALGRTLLEPIVADRDQPPFDRAMMDGYALRRSDLVGLAAGAALRVSATISAGMLHTEPVPKGACVAIATGAAVPAELDTVIQHERSDRGMSPERTHSDDEVRFEPTARTTVARGHAIHARGADARANTILVTAGTRLNAMHLALAATVGATTLSVAAAPPVAILTSGDEVVDPAAQSIGATQIRNSNASLLAALAPDFGGAVVLHHHILDHADETVAGLRDALDRATIVVTVGGVSAGARDHFPGAIAALGGRFVFRGARIRPGGPIAVATFPARTIDSVEPNENPHTPRVAGPNGTDGPLLIALPGNPVSALVCAHLLLRPLIARALGASGELPWRTLPLTDAVRVDPGRQSFRPARWGAEGVSIPTWHGSGDLAHVAITDGIVELPREAGDVGGAGNTNSAGMVRGMVRAGTPVRFLPWTCGIASPEHRR